MPEPSVALTLSDGAALAEEKRPVAHRTKQTAPWFANRVVSKQIPALSEASNRFLLELFRSLQQFICQKSA